MYRFPEELKNVYEKLNIPLIFMDKEDGVPRVLFVSDGFLRFHGMTRETFENNFQGQINDGFFARVLPSETAKLEKISNDFLDEKTDFDVIFHFKQDDGFHLIHEVGFWQELPDGKKIAILAYADMNRHEDVVAKITEKYPVFERDLFFTDPLTGLPNLNYFLKYGAGFAKAFLTNGKESFLAYFDVDSMRGYNDRYGMENGDKLLKLVASVLVATFPKALIARGADDHYLVVDEFTSKDDLVTRLEYINNRIKNEAQGNTTGTHAGIFVYTDHFDSSKALDNARRACKTIGDDMNVRYQFYSDEKKEDYLRQRYIVENFDNAVKNGWLKVYYQCFLRLETDKGYGFEALARWNDPKMGIIPPSQFIPALENYHLMHVLDLYMLDQVCRDIKPRYEAGLPLMPVSVNFSRQDFDYIDVPTEIKKVVDRYDIEQYGIDRSYFIIEITEQDMATATDAFYRQLNVIRESGFQLWVDDFGSGYSSLNVFGRFDIDLIKFDMELLRNLDVHNGANREIIKAMIALAKKLGVHTLCEGMETEEQKKFLKEAGCELAQGYLYHKPEPLDDIFERLGLGIPIPACETEEEREILAKKWTE
jgi:diguanylate cyclase (GGDEF)-like protein